MSKKRFTEEQIVGILKEAQTGIRTEDLCRKYNVSTNTFYNWRQKYGGMEVSDVRRLRRRFRKLSHTVPSLILAGSLLPQGCLVRLRLTGYGKNL